MFDEKVSVLIPFRSDNGCRDEIWSWIKKRYEILMPQAEICVGYSNIEPFCKSEAINNAAKLATRDIFIIADADIAFDIEHIERAIAELPHHIWIIPFNGINYLTVEQTKNLQKKDPGIIMSSVDFTGCVSYMRSYTGGINIVPRKYFEQIGGFDERFKGWGVEDDAFQRAMDTMCGSHIRIKTKIWHLDHPSASRIYYEKNHKLFYQFYKSRDFIIRNFSKGMETNTNEVKENKLLENEMKTESKIKDFIDVSIIIPCKNEVNTLKSTVDHIMNSNNSCSFEIIVVDDASNDLSTEFLRSPLNKDIYKDVILIKTNNTGCAGARNAGAKIAKGNYLFFCDAHIKVVDRWLDNLVNTLKNNNAHIVAPCIVNMKNINMTNATAATYGMTCDDGLRAIWLTGKTNNVTEIPFACGCAFGITREVFEKINGFDHIFQVYGSEDFEICLKAWLYGYRVVVNPEVIVQHFFKTVHEYKISTSNVIFNILCLAYSHFRKERIIKIIDILKNDYSFSMAAADIKCNEELIFKQREKYFKERIYNDDFFFEKFKIPF